MAHPLPLPHAPPKQNATCSLAYLITRGHQPGDELTIDYVQFVVCMWNLCTYDKEGLYRFAFHLYDTDRSGFLKQAEVQKIVEEVYDIHNKSGAAAGDIVQDGDERLQESLNQIAYHSDEDGLMDIKAWKGYILLHDMILWPVFRMQRNAQEEILGRKFWKRQAEKRRIMTHVSGDAVIRFHLLEFLEKPFGPMLVPRESWEG